MPKGRQAVKKIVSRCLFFSNLESLLCQSPIENEQYEFEHSKHHLLIIVAKFTPMYILKVRRRGQFRDTTDFNQNSKGF